MRHRHDPGDPEVSVRQANSPAGELGPLFAQKPWPQAPREEAEQGVLPIHGTIAARYAAWRATDDGERVFEAVYARAVALYHRGEKRISAKHLCEEVRAALHLEFDNRHTALLARELARDSRLEPLIERRVRKAV